VSWLALAACGASPSGDGDAAPGADARPDGQPGTLPALYFGVNEPNEYDHGVQVELPATFGTAEFTLELVVLLDDSFPVGPIIDGGPEQRERWSSTDIPPYSSSDWWYEGNFLLDGHNNNSFGAGTFSLQFYGSGMLRWMFGDGAVDRDGDVWAVQAPSGATSPRLLDGQPHRVACVRRFAAGGGATLELWIDGALVGTESTPARTDMRAYWDTWADFPLEQPGWFWGAEKQAAIGSLFQYEDYKGAIADVQVWDVARSPAELAAGSAASGWTARWSFTERAGDLACDDAGGACWDLVRLQPGAWRDIPAP
jgi:hypothetical protein